MTKEDLQQLVNEVKSKPTIEKVIEILYKLNYRFVSSDFVESLSTVNWAKKFHKKYQWLVRMDHIDQDPTKDVYNTKIMFGIRFFDIRMPGVLRYHKGEYKEHIQIPWKKVATQNMKKKKVPLTFPDVMSIQDRIDWRKYHDKWRAGKELTKEEHIYYFTFKPHIGNLDKEDQHLS